MKAQTIWIITDSCPDLKHELHVLVERADMNQEKLVPLLEDWLKDNLDSWQDGILPRLTLDGCSRSALFAAFAQSAIASFAYDDLKLLAHHYIAGYEDEYCSKKG